MFQVSPLVRDLAVDVIAGFVQIVCVQDLMVTAVDSDRTAAHGIASGFELMFPFIYFDKNKRLP